MTFHLSKPDPDFLFKLALPDVRRRSGLRRRCTRGCRCPRPARTRSPATSREGRRRLVRNPRFRVWSAAAQPDGYPDRIVERYRVHGRVRDPRGRARHGRHHGGRPRSDLAARARGLPADAPLEPALLRADSSRSSALWLNTRLAPFNDVRVRQAFNFAVDRTRLAQINGGRGGVPVPAAERERLQLLLPVQRARPRRRRAGSSPSPAPRGSRSRSGSTTSRPGTGTPRTWSQVLRSIGYKARVEYVPHTPGNLTWRRDRAGGRPRLGRRLPLRQQHLPRVPLQLLYDRPEAIERELRRDLRPASGCAGRSCTVARDDQPRRGGRRLAPGRPHADRRGAVGADEGLRSPPTSSPGGSATTGTAGCRGGRG